MIYIFSYQDYAREIALSLRPTHEITVIAQTNKETDRALDDGFEIFKLNFDSEDFDEINFGFDPHNDIVFVADEDDVINIFLTITLRAKNDTLNIVSLNRARENEHKLKVAGATKVISVDSMSARLIFNILQKPAVSEILDEIVFAQNDIKVSEVLIEEGTFLNGLHIRDLELKKKYNIILFGIVDIMLKEHFMFNHAEFEQIVDAGDKLVVIGLEQDINRLKEDLENSKG
jgi:voltage-gated potassium channel